MLSLDVRCRPTCGRDGFAKDAKLDFVGMTNLLALRAKFAGTQPVSPDRYIDESYYRDALATLQLANPGRAAAAELNGG